jgi:hypothetical protein
VNGGDVMLTRGTRIRITRDLIRMVMQCLNNNEDHLVFESAETSDKGDVTLGLKRATGPVVTELAGDDDAVRSS